MSEPRTVEALDGFKLQATLFEPDDFTSVVLVGPAMGVKRHFYHDFADELSRKGLAVLTFDFRGIGGSARGPIRNQETDITTWAQKDLGGCIEWIRRTYPEKRHTAVLHSLSGQILGLSDRAQYLEKVVTVVSGGGYWNFYPFPKNLGLAFVWYCLYPMPAHLMGYFPGSTLGLGEDLPKNVALEVSRWGRSPNYIDNYSNYDSVKADVLAYSFTDDSYCPKVIVDYMHDQYTNANINRRHVNPNRINSDGIGHFGFFRNGTVPELRSETISWLKA